LFFYFEASKTFKNFLGKVHIANCLFFYFEASKTFKIFLGKIFITTKRTINF
jgi:hypothetical protein